MWCFVVLAKGMEQKTVKEKWASEASREDAHPIMLVALSHTKFKNIFYENFGACGYFNF